MKQPHLTLSVSDCKNILYYLEPHEKTVGVTAFNPQPYESIKKVCDYCRQRININEAANCDGFLNNEYNDWEY
tara:strand:- start:494 stop:712 length:219 start_codon:yes stop_codon:yes gene_type:complete